MKCRINRILVAAAIGLSVLVPGRAGACESCAVFSATSLRESRDNTWSASVSEQYTEYQKAGAGVSNEQLRDGEILKRYSSTQFDVAYDYTKWLGAQLSLPIISREFDTVRSFRRSEESETGLGDLSLLVKSSPLSYRQLEYAVHGTLYAGLKFPTGDTGSLDEQIGVDENLESAERNILGLKHHQGGGIPGLNGQVLSLGTGSWDTFYGFGTLARWDRYLFIITGEYTLRTEGDFNYRFANDLLWSVGPAVYLLLRDELTVSLQALFSGEHKDKDVHDGVKVGGTSVANIYTGPSFILTAGERMAGEIAFQLPIYTDNPGAVVVPDFRITAGVNFRF